MTWPLVTLDLSKYGQPSPEVVEPASPEVIIGILRSRDTSAATIRDLIADQIEEQTRPQVYSHMVIPVPEGKRFGFATSLCGKVWRPSENVTFLGKCPDCLRIMDEEVWTV